MQPNYALLLSSFLNWKLSRVATVGQQDAPGLGLFSPWVSQDRQSQGNIPDQAFIVRMNFTSSEEVKPTLTSEI